MEVHSAVQEQFVTVSVIGNAEWNTAPFIGLPWGLMGNAGVFYIHVVDYHNGKRTNRSVGINAHKNWN